SAQMRQNSKRSIGHLACGFRSDRLISDETVQSGGLGAAVIWRKNPQLFIRAVTHHFQIKYF
ncbi:hypothetical protein, partial [Lyngbya sp. CCY1209]|uniref:hypothetical protein n=1 Tax=Lyngbya sp. CCY1209 TaxID=2886103 RepID=UPI002D214AAA